jgi:hypothetical protein
MRLTVLVLIAVLVMSDHAAAAQDLQTSNDWATGSAHAAVVDSINRENVKRLRREKGPRRPVVPNRASGSAGSPRWTPAQRAQKCAVVRPHLRRLDAKQLRAYRAVCG